MHLILDIYAGHISNMFYKLNLLWSLGGKIHQLELPKYHMCAKSNCHLQCCSYVEMFILKLNKCSTKFDTSVKENAPVMYLCDLLAKKSMIIILVTQMLYC